CARVVYDYGAIPKSLDVW
nr:immunoglobulin heavy chain junction region [Macaca mulatta]